MTAIMVETLNFIATATKEIKQGRTSNNFLYRNTFPLINSFTERYLKKLMGKNNIENTLKKLDRLTQEEALMAAAQLLNVTNRIDNRVANVDDRVAGVEERVAGIDQRVAGVDDRIACVDNQVRDVDDRVKDVDGKVAIVGDGMQYVFYLSS